MAGKRTTYFYQGGYTVKGNIYAAGKTICPVCGRKFEHFDGTGIFCPDHPVQRPSGLQVRYGRQITKRFSGDDYKDAWEFLNGLRFEERKGTFDARDYQIRGKPLSLTVLTEQWLEIKKATIRHGSYISLRSHIRPAQAYFGDMNIKYIGYADIELFIVSQNQWADKTRFNALATLKEFWDWCYKAHDIERLKDWPRLKRPQMGYRKILDLETQELIINTVKNQIIASNGNLKIWLGIKLLATYPSIRPKELWSLDEKHIDRKNGFLLVPESVSKDGRLKTIPLDAEDVKEINQFVPGVPNLPFFRHDHCIHKSRIGKRIGKNSFWEAWKKACKALGIEGVDLYGGTKHSTITAMRQVLTFEETKEAAMITSNKALERYMQLKGERLQNMYATRRKLLDKTNQEKGKVINLRDD